MGDAKMTKGYALVVCENGHGVWGGETVEEAQKHINAQCRECDEPCEEENTIRYTPPHIIPPTEADTLRAQNARLRAFIQKVHDVPPMNTEEIRAMQAEARRALEEG